MRNSRPAPVSGGHHPDSVDVRVGGQSMSLHSTLTEDRMLFLRTTIFRQKVRTRQQPVLYRNSQSRGASGFGCIGSMNIVSGLSLDFLSCSQYLCYRRAQSIRPYWSKQRVSRPRPQICKVIVNVYSPAFIESSAVSLATA